MEKQGLNGKELADFLKISAQTNTQQRLYLICSLVRAMPRQEILSISDWLTKHLEERAALIKMGVIFGSE